MQVSDAGDLATGQNGGKIVIVRNRTRFGDDRLALGPIVESYVGYDFILLHSFARGFVGYRHKDGPKWTRDLRAVRMRTETDNQPPHKYRPYD
jgi:hypothetical protein